MLKINLPKSKKDFKDIFEARDYLLSYPIHRIFLNGELRQFEDFNEGSPLKIIDEGFAKLDRLPYSEWEKLLKNET